MAGKNSLGCKAYMSFINIYLLGLVFGILIEKGKLVIDQQGGLCFFALTTTKNDANLLIYKNSWIYSAHNGRILLVNSRILPNKDG
jgi:hypothetical protein